MMHKKLLYIPELHSPLGSFIKEYIERKRALHFKFNAEAFVLGRFDKYCLSAGITAPVLTKELLTAWSNRFPDENETSHYLRVRVVRAFCIFLHNCGHNTPKMFHPLPSPSHSFKPYIFSHDEINALFKSIDENSRIKRTVSPIRHLVIPIMFRTIYGCGLRVAEATHLKTCDVNLFEGTASIKDTKNNCDRMVAFSSSLADIIRSYGKRQEITSFGSKYFFPAPDRGYYSNSTIYNIFRDCLFYAGIPHGGRGKGPRLHDLRHSFAVHTLSNWQRNGKDTYVCLPILSAYMGHQNLYETQKYLRLVPESYKELTEIFCQKFPNIFPEA